MDEFDEYDEDLDLEDGETYSDDYGPDEDGDLDDNLDDDGPSISTKKDDYYNASYYEKSWHRGWSIRQRSSHVSSFQVWFFCRSR